MTEPATSTPREAKSALSVPGYPTFLVTFMLTMMADNVEHVISYWVVFQKFHSTALAGFAVVAHWLPFLLFSVAVGALNDRFDSRRLIQAGGVLFALVSLGWGYFFITDSLRVEHAMVLLVLHGLAGVFWTTSSQMLLYDIVGHAHLQSAVRLNASARYLGVLIGPAVGSAMMLTLGPTKGIFVNALFYLPLLLWLVRAPYGKHFHGAAAPAAAAPRRPVRGLADILEAIRAARAIPVLAAMILLAAAVSFFIGNSYQAQMPAFASDLGHGDPGTAYTVLLAADAAGALFAGVLLEARGGLLRTRPASAMVFSALWALSLLSFALVRSYPAAIALLFAAGFFELSSSSMNQTIVQLNAPDSIRGRILGLFNMAGAGVRTFSGITVGLAGTLRGPHFSLALSAGVFLFVVGALSVRYRGVE